MSKLAIQIYDTAQGCPAAGLEVSLAYLQENGQWLDLGTGPTDESGQIAQLMPRSFPLRTGMYRLSLSTSHYFAFSGMQGLFPVVPIVVELAAADRDYLAQVSLSRYGYTIAIH